MGSTSALKSILIFIVSITILSVSAIADSADDYMKRNKQRKKDEQKAAIEQVQDCMPPNLSEMPPEIQAEYKSLEEVGNRGAVLVLWRIYHQQLAVKNMEEATRVLDLILTRIGGSSAGDESAKKARSTFKGEDEKNFRGEPYEQAMIYLQRGLLYMCAGDYENARAMFRSGALVDRSSEDAKKDEEYHDDLAEMDYCEAVCNTMLGLQDRSDECLKVSREHARSENAVLPIPDGVNSLLVIGLGVGPKKYATGEYAQFLRFNSGSGASGPLDVLINGTSVATMDGPLDNMSFQAMTRGGRAVDAILKGKAQFKKGASVAGDLAIVSGALAAGVGDSDSAPGVGAGLMVLGLISKGISAAANPAADIRMLSVPDDIYIIPLNLSPGTHTIQIKCTETGTVTDGQITRSDQPFDVLTAWDPSFGVQVNNVRFAKYTEEGASLIGNASERWTGGWGKKKEQVNIELAVISRQDETFAGYVKTTGGGWPEGVFPCSGAIDKKAMRIEYHCTPDKSMHLLLTGKTSKSSTASTGTAYFVSASGMSEIGKYKISKSVGKNDESTPKSSSKKSREKT